MLCWITSRPPPSNLQSPVNDDPGEGGRGGLEFRNQLVLAAGQCRRQSEAIHSKAVYRTWLVSWRVDWAVQGVSCSLCEVRAGGWGWLGSRVSQDSGGTSLSGLWEIGSGRWMRRLLCYWRRSCQMCCGYSCLPQRSLANSDHTDAVGPFWLWPLGWLKNVLCHHWQCPGFCTGVHLPLDLRGI